MVDDSSQQSANKDLRGLPLGRERIVMVMEPEAELSKGHVEVDLGELWNIVWGGRWLIIGVTAMCALASVGYVLLAPQWYRAEALLIPASDNFGGGLSGQLGQLGGLASLAGIDVGGDDDSSEALAVLESPGFSRDFIEAHNLLPVLFDDEWDAEANRWKSADSSDWPEIRDAVKYFTEDIRRIETNARTGIISLSIEWTDPEVAAQWANMLVERVNERMRERALQDAETNVAYLTEQMGTSNLVALQQSIGALLKNELEKLMIARGNEQFAFRFVDRASAPKWRSRPRRTQIVILSIVLGGAVSLAAVFARAYIRMRRTSTGASAETSAPPRR